MLRGHQWICAVVVLASMSAQAQVCMMPPTDKGVVSGRFGKVRGGGAGNFGSANTHWHVHDGLDFSTDRMSLPVYATADGVITHVGMLGTAGNAILLRRDNGDVVAYYHMGGFDKDIRVGTRVQAGKKLGVSGNTPAATMLKHLHLSYGSTNQQDARAVAFQGLAERKAGGPFKPEELQYSFSRNHLGWRTDPSPFFCQSFSINDGHPEDYATLGRDTKAQNSIMLGSSASGEGLDPAQMAAAGADTVRTGSNVTTPDRGMKDGEVFGMPPLPPIGEYDAMSSSEMMMTEAWKRFSDENWEQNIRKLSYRALWVDYNRALAFGNFMQREIDRKKEKIEALLAIYATQRLKNMRDRVDASHERAATGMQTRRN